MNDRNVIVSLIFNHINILNSINLIKETFNKADTFEKLQIYRPNEVEQEISRHQSNSKQPLRSIERCQRAATSSSHNPNQTIPSKPRHVIKPSRLDVIFGDQRPWSCSLPSEIGLKGGCPHKSELGSKSSNVWRHLESWHPTLSGFAKNEKLSNQLPVIVESYPSFLMRTAMLVPKERPDWISLTLWNQLLQRLAQDIEFFYPNSDTDSDDDLGPDSLLRTYKSSMSSSTISDQAKKTIKALDLYRRNIATYAQRY